MAVARQYRLISVLGQGGFGTVYRARMQGEGGFSKQVALKVLNPDLSNTGELARRLRDEARVLGLVQHRAIVKVDSLLNLDGRWTVVMEYVEGRDLRTILERGPIPLGPALEVGAEVASALGAAWNANGPDDRPLRLLHRDIKPANICVTALGEVKVLDFGIARAEFTDRESTTHSQSFGTPDYMSPERFIYENGPEADVYALGATLFEMMSGERLGRASPRPDVHAAFMSRRLEELGRRLGPAQTEVVALIDEMIRYEPRERPSAREVERRLLRLRHASTDALLRDWAEVVLPPLIAIQEAREDEATGAVLAEQVEPAEAPRPAWPTPAGPARREANTYALASGPAQPTLVAMDEPVSAPAPAPRARAPWIAAAVLLAALGAAAALWLSRPDAVVASAPDPAPLPSPAAAAPVSETPPVASSPPDTQPVVSAAPAPRAAAPKQTAAPATASAAPSATTTAAESTPASATAEPATAVEGGAPTGTWEGSVNGRPLDLVLKGSSAALRGEVVISLGASSVRSPVRGSFDSASGALTLEDTEDTPDAGRYRLTLSEDGGRLSGYFEQRDGGGRVAITASRAR